MSVSRRIDLSPLSILLLVNRASGTGHGADLPERLRSVLRADLGVPASIDAAVVEDHPQARSATRAFLAAHREGAAIVVGGGGGTLRAVVEGVFDATPSEEGPPPERVRLAPLRLGSGNVVAKQFGVPLDPVDAAKGIAAGLRSGRTAPCGVIRCRFGRPRSFQSDATERAPATPHEREWEVSAAQGFSLAAARTDVRYATTMCGLGQFGRAPGDLARWHRRLPAVRRLVARLAGIERVNDVEYATAMLARMLWAAVRPGTCEEIEIHRRGSGGSEGRIKLRLFAGVAMNFRVKGLPFSPGVSIEEAAISLHLVPLTNRADALRLLIAPRRALARVRTWRLNPGDGIEIRFVDRDEGEFFLDEDPENAHGWMSVEPAGTLAFVPGLAYVRATGAGVQ